MLFNIELVYDSSSLYITFTVIFVRILFLTCLLFYISTSTYVFLILCSVREPDAADFFLKLTFFLLNEAASFVGIDVEIWRSKMLKCLISSHIMTTAGFNKILFPFLQLHTSILHNYLWSQ